MPEPSAAASSETSVTLRVRLFAAYREAAGTNRLDLTLPRGAKVSDAIAALTERVPRLSATRGLVAVNQEYVGPDFTLHDGDELALIPPVSGGTR